MKTFTPELQKYINEKNPKTQDVGVLIGFIALFAMAYMAINIGFQTLIGTESFMQFNLNILEVVFVAALVLIRARVVDHKIKAVKASIQSGAFDFQSTNWDAFNTAANLGRRIVEFKLDRLFANDIVAARFNAKGAVVVVQPETPVVADQLRKAVLHEFGVPADNLKLATTGKSYQFEMNLSGLKLLEPEDLVEFK